MHLGAGIPTRRGVFLDLQVGQRFQPLRLELLQAFFQRQSRRVEVEQNGELQCTEVTL